MNKVFIDGDHGTTGLRIAQRLAQHGGVTVIQLEERDRKDPHRRKQIIEQSDITFLCLPDHVAAQTVPNISGGVRVIDTSSQYRTVAGWVYGFAEINRDIKASLPAASRVSVPGCHATGYIALIYPLVSCGVIARSSLLSCTSLTGYSGGGKQMIEQYRAPDRPSSLSGAGFYACSQDHKHLREMAQITGMDKPPVFLPVLTDYYAGMVTSVPFHISQLNGIRSAGALAQLYQDFYHGKPLIQVLPFDGQQRSMPVNEAEGYDSMILSVEGNNQRMTVTARFDNLGKGSCGAAIQCMNLMLGMDECRGLII